MTTTPCPHAYIGTSGWSYAGWRHGFYAGVPQKRWLAHCATRFTAIEVNATFYRTLVPDVVGRWRTDTPATFAFAAKGHRMVTHRRRLRDVDEPLARTRDGLAPLGDRLTAVLWQLPPTLGRDDGLLRDFADRLDTWPGPRHVIEFRDPSWFNDETLTLLGTRNLGTCISDAAKWPCWDAVSGRIAYVRLHGHERTYESAYGERGVRPWAARVVDWLSAGYDVHVYFDNDAEGAAPYDAVELIAQVGAAGGTVRAP